jgi:hypothetical protein
MSRERILAVTTDPIAGFFAELGGRGYEPLLRKAVGNARFDVVDGRRVERWLVTIDKGNIEVSRRNAAADCVLRVERAAFARVAAGELNLMAAALRAEVAIQGDPKLLVLLQRLFPRPSGGRPQSQRSGSDSSGSEE